MATREELETQLQTARKDIEALAVLAGQTARDQARNGADTANAQVSQLSDEARAMFDAARNEGTRLRAATEDRIRSNPIGTMGIAFAAGLILANVLGRR